MTLDYRARDTLGNFTSLVDELASRKVDHVLLVSEDHLSRSMAVGQVVAGSRGIHQPVYLSPAPRPVRGSLDRTAGDWVRAVAWVVTGRDLQDAAFLIQKHVDATLQLGGHGVEVGPTTACWRGQRLST